MCLELPNRNIGNSGVSRMATEVLERNEASDKYT